MGDAIGKHGLKNVKMIRHGAIGKNLILIPVEHP